MHLKKIGYNLKSMWECDFREFLKKNPSIDNRLNNNPLLMFNYLNPRDALFGGRTEVFKLYYKPKAGEKIRYLDFCSLYPYVNWKGQYPIGHPKKILIGQQECDSVDFDQIEGIIKCRILAPQTLKIPVLPAKIDGKLLFVLCRTCAEIQNVYACTHTEMQRSLIGTWVTAEVKMALKHGYRIQDKIEIWVYDMEQYVSGTNDKGLFTAYMKTFLKIKQEASGWPPNCKTPEERKAYVQNYADTEDIHLNESRIENNPSYRSLAKLCANSLWGKLCQRNERIHTTIIKEPNEFYKMLISPAIQVNDVYTVENAVCVNWKYTHPNEDEKPSKNACIPVGAYTTANARVVLFNELIELQHEILYCDTDSIIYVEHANLNYTPSIGSAVGQLTDEIQEYGDDAYISEYVSVGPKSYSLKITIPSQNKIIEVCKCKGFRLNRKNATVLHFNNFKNMVFGDNPVVYENGQEEEEEKRDNTCIQTSNVCIKRQKGFVLTTHKEEKKFQFTFTKRVCIDEHGDTLPYGHIDIP